MLDGDLGAVTSGKWTLYARTKSAKRKNLCTVRFGPLRSNKLQLKRKGTRPEVVSQGGWGKKLCWVTSEDFVHPSTTLL
jgi:hypothetical protein